MTTHLDRFGKSRVAVVASLGLQFIMTSVHAGVPTILQYQGRIVQNGVNYDGDGEFKFSLVRDSGEVSEAILWHNDGTNTSQAEPANAVSLSVTKGLFSVLLGDSSETNMSTIDTTVFSDNDHVSLRVWFKATGEAIFEQLSPDQRVAAVGFAVVAGQSLDIADGAVTSSKIAAGAVEGAHLAAGAVADGLAADGQAPVVAGGIVLSEDADNTEFLNAGYIRLPTSVDLIDGAWSPIGESGPDTPFARILHSAIWTGSEMIIWGGIGPVIGRLNTGGLYNPATNTWSPTDDSGFNVPEARAGHAAVWTGTVMIIWGGRNVARDLLSSGGRYNPIDDAWTVTDVGADLPEARVVPTAVWTDTEMIVWGGISSTDILNTGGRYDPTDDSWSATDVVGGNVPGGGLNHTAVWTGTEMIIWGGFDSNFQVVNTGGRYDPTSNSWSAIDDIGGNVPSARRNHTAVWTEAKMVIWGGRDNNNPEVNTGARYDPNSNSWSATDVSGGNVPSARRDHTAVWSGGQMIIWGGGRHQPTTEYGGTLRSLAGHLGAHARRGSEYPEGTRETHCSLDGHGDDHLGRSRKRKRFS